MARSLNSLFCDDIRQEIGNKLSLMGVYTHQMLVDRFPFDLPRLCVVMRAMAPAEEYFKELKFVVMINDDTVAEMVIPADNPAQHVPVHQNIEGATDLQHRQVVQTIFALPPIRIEQPCVIRTRIITESEMVRGDSLVVSQLPQPATTAE